MSKSKAQLAQEQTEREEAIARLREIFPSGSTVSCVVRHVSSSGMSRAISVLAHDPERKEITDISYLVARATQFKLHPRRAGLKVDGTGMDMVFHLVYSLSSVLYREELGNHDGPYSLKSRAL